MSTNPYHNHPGAAIPDVENPMAEGVGAASWAKNRADRPDLTLAGEPKIQPMSILPDFHVDSNDRDPHGMKVFGADDKVAGTVTDIWVDRSEPQIRYLQMEIEGGAPVLLPMGFCKLGLKGIHVKALYSHQFGAVPRPKAQDQITLLEEDKIVGYFAGGYRYADPDRNEPLF